MLFFKYVLKAYNLEISKFHNLVLALHAGTYGKAKNYETIFHKAK